MGPTITAVLGVLAEHPDDANVLYEVGGAYDTDGQEDVAVDYPAMGAGLEGHRLRQCYLQLGSTLRNLGRFVESLRVFDEGCARFPESESLVLFRAAGPDSGSDAGRDHGSYEPAHTTACECDAECPRRQRQFAHRIDREHRRHDAVAEEPDVDRPGERPERRMPVGVAHSLDDVVSDVATTRSSFGPRFDDAHAPLQNGGESVDDGIEEGTMPRTTARPMLVITSVRCRRQRSLSAPTIVSCVGHGFRLLTRGVVLW